MPIDNELQNRIDNWIPRTYEAYTHFWDHPIKLRDGSSSPRLELIKEWLTALNSGEYEQGQRLLKATFVREDGNEFCYYCCLGVACEMIGDRLEFPVGEALMGEVDFRKIKAVLIPKGNLSLKEVSVFGVESNLLPISLMDVMGFVGGAGPTNYLEYPNLALANDKGKTFTELIKIVMSIPEGLFKYDMDT